MNALHSLLRRQWKRHFGDRPVPDEFLGFLGAVDSAYRESDQDRTMLERSLELNSQELLEANADLRAMFHVFPDLLFRIDEAGRISQFKAGINQELGLRGEDVIGKRIQDVIAAAEPDDPLGGAIRRAVQWRAMANIEFGVKRGGDEWFYEARVVPLRGEHLVVIIRNINERRRAERLRVGQIEVFEMVAAGKPLGDQLGSLTRLLESQMAGARCAVFLADPEGKFLHMGSAPSLPAEFAREKSPILEGAGSCGTAAARKAIVIVNDTEQDPLWSEMRPIAQRYGIGSCCSVPIVSRLDTLVGTLAVYFAAPHSPTPDELHLASLGAHIAGLAIQRQRSEEQLFDSRRMLRMVLDTIPQRVFWKDRNCVYVGCNKPLAEDCGYKDPAEMLGRTDFDTTSASLAEVYRADDQRVMATDEAKLNYEEPQASADGEQRWLKTSKVPLHDKDGRVIGILGTYEDITERKRAEEALRRAEEKYRNIVENAVEGIFQSTREGRVIEANPAFAQMLGFATPGELMTVVTDMRTQLFVDPVGHDEFVRMLESRGVVQRFETQMRRRDGRIMWISLNVRCVRDAERKILYYEGFAVDITERKQLEEQFRQSQKMEAFGQLAGGIAHDFNNILTVIRVSTAMLQEEGLSTEEQESAIAETLRASDRAADLTRQLLTFSRRQPIQAQPLDLNEVLAGMTKMFQRVIGEHIVLETHYAPGAAMVHADAGMMEQALMNLAVNSRDAMPKGGTLTLLATVERLDAVAVESRPNVQPGNYVRLRVRDTGVGIEPEHLPHIFEPFFTTKEVGRGTGLGLAMVFGIVTQHGGWVEVESKPNDGATFDLYFQQLQEQKPAANERRGISNVQTGHETILLAEDETDVRALMKTMLERHGYRVLAATSGVAALQVWEQKREDIDLLVTDMIMPEGINGRELAERLVADKPNLKVIYCSGYTDEMLGRDSLLRSDVNFIEKPFDVDVLLRRVRDCLDR
jgi:two-component system, cell cycle sensor histidine kinase and response regulator CckA